LALTDGDYSASLDGITLEGDLIASRRVIDAGLPLH